MFDALMTFYKSLLFSPAFRLLLFPSPESDKENRKLLLARQCYSILSRIYKKVPEILNCAVHLCIAGCHYLNLFEMLLNLKNAIEL